MSQLEDTTRIGPLTLGRPGRDRRRRARRSLDASDEEMLRRIAYGDGDALAVLHHRWADLVHANVRRVLREPALAEQVTEQVFHDLSTVACRFDPSRGDALLWLLALAHERATARAVAYREPPRSLAASEPWTTSWATRFSFRLVRRA